MVVGLGLLRFDNRARLGVYAFSIVGILNMLVTVTPWGQARYDRYNASIYSQMPMEVPPAHPFVAPHALIAVGLVFAVVCYGLQYWLIERQRARFLAPKSARTIVH